MNNPKPGYPTRAAAKRQRFHVVTMAKQQIKQLLDRMKLDVDAMELAFYCQKCGPEYPLIRTGLSILECINCDRRMQVHIRLLP